MRFAIEIVTNWSRIVVKTENYIIFLLMFLLLLMKSCGPNTVIPSSFWAQTEENTLLVEMKMNENRCLNCRYYRLESLEDGCCRFVKNSENIYPRTVHDDSCPNWKGCGQQYYIRIGWLKGQREKEIAVPWTISEMVA